MKSLPTQQSVHHEWMRGGTDPTLHIVRLNDSQRTHRTPPLVYTDVVATSTLMPPLHRYGRPTKTKGPERPLCNGAGAAAAGAAAGAGGVCPVRDQSNIASMLSWLTATQPAGFDNIYAFELGNELNSCLNGEKGAVTTLSLSPTLSLPPHQP